MLQGNSYHKIRGWLGIVHCVGDCKCLGDYCCCYERGTRSMNIICLLISKWKIRTIDSKSLKKFPEPHFWFLHHPLFIVETLAPLSRNNSTPPHNHTLDEWLCQSLSMWVLVEGNSPKKAGWMFPLIIICFHPALPWMMLRFLPFFFSSNLSIVSIVCVGGCNYFYCSSNHRHGNWW